MAIKKLLVANRGEIACRVIRTAKVHGIVTVAVYSKADKNAAHVRTADEAVCIGEPSPVHSYLSIDNICRAIESSGADAVHPGYGFLSESPAFAKRLSDMNIVFIGPSVTAIEQMGNKGTAKRLMQTAGVPCLPGYEGTDQSDEALIQAAETIGYPVMVKAAAGGGGRGMRLVTEPDRLEQALSAARAEAYAGFASKELILEKALIAPRHIEVQVMADHFGNCIHLAERDCSIQRRHQKIIEEAPCASISPETRESMGAAAVNAAQAVSYSGAGTVEFLMDSSGTFYFLEMNTRLQVEHPVTEMITGLDLVAMQLQIASGLPLSIAQSDVKLSGHAIEARLCAENPVADFMPTTGAIHCWQVPASTAVRIDAGIDEGTEVTPWYDSMLAKVIAHGATREQARQRLCKALSDIVLLGPATNQHFLYKALTTDSFASADVTTAFIEDTWPDGYQPETPNPAMQAIAIALIASSDFRNAMALSATVIAPDLVGWSSGHAPLVPINLQAEDSVFEARVRATPGGRKWQVTLVSASDAKHPSGEPGQHNVEFIDLDSEGGNINSRRQSKAEVIVNHHRYTIYYAQHCDTGGTDTLWIAHGAACWQFSRVTTDGASVDSGEGEIVAPMHGLIVELLVKEGQTVTQGQSLAVLEAMKMQHQISAASAGTITRISTAAGAQVRSGDSLIQIETETNTGSNTDSNTTSNAAATETKNHATDS